MSPVAIASPVDIAFPVAIASPVAISAGSTPLQVCIEFYNIIMGYKHVLNTEGLKAGCV